MTIYYIDPSTGNNTNTGLSWAQAWLNLRGLRQNAIVPVAGDEIRMAKSATFSPTEGSYTYLGGGYPEWIQYGETQFDFRDTVAGVNRFRRYGAPSALRYPIIPISVFSGAVDHQVPVGMSSYYPIPATSSTGGFNTPSVELFGGSMYVSGSDASGKTILSGFLRCHIPYVGSGDQDFPAGALSIGLFSGATLIRSQTIDTAIRNSATEWTPFSVTFTALPATALDRVVLMRTAATVTRSTATFGMELSEMVLQASAGVGDANTVCTATRASYVSGRDEDIVAPNDIRIIGECLNQGNVQDGSNITLSIGADVNNRISTAIASYLRAYVQPGIAWTGALADSPAGSLGMFDLNGSTGGTLGNPLKITGGWNTSSGLVDGVTVLSAGLSHAYGSSFAFLDLNGTDHIKVENISASYGFGSFFTRAKTIHLLKCHLPFSVRPAFGITTTDTNVMLESMYVCPLTLEGLGTFGDFTLKDTYYGSSGNTWMDQTFECGNLVMDNAHLGRWRTITSLKKKYKIRGNATLTNCSLTWPPMLVSVQFGNTLSFTAHKPFSSEQQVYLIPTAPESRWDHIYYGDTTMPTYAFGTQSPTGATCDAKVSIQGFAVLNTESATVAHYPTALRGNHVNGVYGDGITTFTADLNLATGPNSPMGHQYNHSAQLTDTVSHTALTSLQDRGDVSSPPWAYTALRSTPDTQVVNTDPDIAATGRLHIARRFENVTYRSEDTVFLVTMRQVSIRTGPQRVTLKAIYCPKAGLYRAHFGFMGENLQWDNIWSLQILQPLRMVTGIPMPMDGRKIGAVSVFSGPLVGPVVEVPYYAATPAEGLAGGGNRDFNQWRDMYLDFELSAGGLVELRLTSTDFGNFEMSIFDTLTIHERT